jgi:MoaA/NifB/PqqE/SkfB family radical SAM enzyme
MDYFGSFIPIAAQRPTASCKACVSGEDELSLSVATYRMFIQWLHRIMGEKPSSAAQVSPRNVGLEVSSFCQLRCPSCPTTTRAIHPAVGSGFLKFEDFRKLVDLNPALERIEISNYGEVFLNPKLPDILEYAYNKGITITIGGANLNHARKKTLEALVKYQVHTLTCSIDGASPETYRLYRVRGDFNAVMQNIQTINGFKRHYGWDLPRLVWQFIVFGHNEREISTARAMAAEYNMLFCTKLTWDDKFSPLNDKEFVRAQIGDDAVTRDEFEKKYGQKYLRSICYQLWDSPQINWDGKVLGCCRNFWGDFGGNAFSEGLSKSINSDKMAYAREMLSGRRPPRDDIPCTNCEMYHAMRDRSEFIGDR